MRGNVIMVFRSNYKVHMDQRKGGWNQGREVGGMVAEKCRQLYFSNNKISYK